MHITVDKKLDLAITASGWCLLSHVISKCATVKYMAFKLSILNLAQLKDILILIFFHSALHCLLF